MCKKGFQLEKIFLVIDESGAKGYSDNREKHIGEVGVMAGFLVPEEYLEGVRTDFEGIKQKYFTEGKVHITDLAPEEQESLRNEIFDYILQRKIICLFEAIHSEGFFQHFEFVKEIHNKAKATRRSKVKISSNEKRELLHEQLFQGTFGKAIAMCQDNVGEVFHLAVITDQIDLSIKKKFEGAADELLNFGNKKIKIVTGFDPEKKEKVAGSITTTIENHKEILGDFSGINYSIECEDSGLTLAADVLANSLNYHFINRSEKDLGAALSTKSALEGYPLEGVMYGLWESDELNYFSDAFFMHPKNPSK